MFSADVVFAQQEASGRNRDDGAGRRAGGPEVRRGGGQGGGGQRGRGQRGGGRRGGEQGGDGLFSLLDVDGDGQLSPKEINGAVAVLAKLDVNKDGILDANELAVRGQGGGDRGGQGGRQGGGGQGGGGKGNGLDKS